jgi:hypothetical protein
MTLIFSALVVAALLPFAYVRFFLRPSAGRDWSVDQNIMPRVHVAGDAVRIDHLRNFVYASADAYTLHYETREYDLRKLDSVWYGVVRFGNTPGVAHTFLSFGFGGDYVAVSIEVRRERGERYSVLKGLLRQYEIMYVIADERDVIALRTHFRRDRVYLYPARVAPAQARALFLDVLARANALAERPEFYNSLTNNCMTSIVRHVNSLAPAIPFSWKTILPAYSDRLAYDLELIPADAPFETVRDAHRIDLRAREGPVDAGFSRRIRAGLPAGRA